VNTQDEFVTLDGLKVPLIEKKPKARKKDRCTQRQTKHQKTARYIWRCAEPNMGVPPIGH
jgi:hypothetical protein